MADSVDKVLGEPRAAATQRVIDRLRKYVELESPSRSEAQIRALANVIAADLRDAGLKADVIDAPRYGAHVVAEIGGSARDHIVILSHMDTVHPVGTLQTQPFKVDAERVHGPGTYDMKAGIAIAV